MNAMNTMRKTEQPWQPTLVEMLKVGQDSKIERNQGNQSRAVEISMSRPRIKYWVRSESRIWQRQKFNEIEYLPDRGKSRNIQRFLSPKQVLQEGYWRPRPPKHHHGDEIDGNLDGQMNCYIMLHHVTSCYIMLHHVTSCYIMLHLFQISCASTCIHVQTLLEYNACAILEKPRVSRWSNLLTQKFSRHLQQFICDVHVLTCCNEYINPHNPQMKERGTECEW